LQSRSLVEKVLDRFAYLGMTGGPAPRKREEKRRGLGWEGNGPFPPDGKPPGGNGFLRLRTSADQAKDQNDDGDDEDEMDEAAGDMEGEESKEPENQENHENRPDHIPLLFPG
jgi:hypothetical protein